MLSASALASTHTPTHTACPLSLAAAARPVCPLCTPSLAHSSPCSEYWPTRTLLTNLQTQPSGTLTGHPGTTMDMFLVRHGVDDGGLVRHGVDDASPIPRDAGAGGVVANSTPILSFRKGVSISPSPIRSEGSGSRSGSRNASAQNSSLGLGRLAKTQEMRLNGLHAQRQRLCGKASSTGTPHTPVGARTDTVNISLMVRRVFTD